MKISWTLLFAANRGADHLRQEINYLKLKRILRIQIALVLFLWISAFVIDKDYHSSKLLFRILLLVGLPLFYWVCKGAPIPVRNKHKLEADKNECITGSQYHRLP